MNLSNREIPAATYIFVAKGLGFVPSHKVDQHDLKYDTTEFLRKLAWRAFFETNPELQNGHNTTEHEDIRISAFTHPNFNHPSLDEIKTKLYGWIANHQPATPKQNLTPLEMRGKKWLLDEIKSGNLFVTKADKGGATLIMNREDVQSAIEKELFDTTKFEVLERNAEQQLKYVKEEVKWLSIFLEQKKMITGSDKTLITGLTENNRPKLAPEYHPESPYVYPLFKIHKLQATEIAEKKIPPSRLVHASKYGPLYRMEKWSSPYLTTISRKFCENEFVMDTANLIQNLEELNQHKALENENVHLFTMDVEALYPSINPTLALEAVQEALLKDTTTERNTKTALGHFLKLSFNTSYVTYKDRCYKSKVGIPTGGSLSRQIADIFMHWVLFSKVNPKISDIQAIRFWKRFIDDIIGIWRGTRRSFDNFVKLLNQECRKFGIKFPLKEVQFGKQVHCLDISAYLDDDNTVHYRSYMKPTDCKRYLNPNSFHPRFVFNSIPFSQLLRTLRNNSKEETKTIETKQCIKDFVNSGYKLELLQTLEEKAISKVANNATEEEEENTLIFAVHYFEGLSELQTVVSSLKCEFQQLIGGTRIMFAVKKGSSLGNILVQNKKLCVYPNNNPGQNPGQKCNGPGCRQCPLVNESPKLYINGFSVTPSPYLNCKSKNVIYLWVCKICGEKECYFGRTTQECRNRTSGHRSCFNDAEKWDKSALSMHAREVHQMDFSLNNFKISVVKQVSPQQLRRTEFKYIDKYKTNSLGLNRYKS